MEEVKYELQTNKEEHKTFMRKLDELSKGQEDIKITLAGLPERLAEKFDERYASKEYENSLKRLNWLVISAVIVALLALIIKVK